MRALRPWPESLAARTALVLLGGLLLSQIGGLMLHALDRADLLHAAREHEAARHLMATYRSVVLARPEQRANLIDPASQMAETRLSLHGELPELGMPPASARMQRLVQSLAMMVALPPTLRPRTVLVHGSADDSRLAVALELPEGGWLLGEMSLQQAWPWHSAAFLATFGVMSAVAALLTLWAVRRLIQPVVTLGAAAEALGRDVNAPPLPENGPAELAAAAAAFNTMAARIRRFVDDRTFLLSAIGHDLRTPITRLRLRAEFMEDDDQRRRMLADLDELEAMVNATLDLGRDVALAEPAVPVDLAALVKTVLADSAATRPGLPAEAIGYAGPAQLTVVARPVALKRALTNLVANALDYGGTARVALPAPHDAQVVLHVDDAGPGIPPEELERVFLPFQRLEPSRNRETGGVGLGLPIVRNILRAHGGDVTLRNRPGGGLRATMVLPA